MSSIPNDKKQVMITLPNDVIKIIDELAQTNYIKRSQMISRIIIDYTKQINNSQDNKI